MSYHFLCPLIYLFFCIRHAVQHESTAILTHKPRKCDARAANQGALTVSQLNPTRAAGACVCAEMTHPDNSVWYSNV